MKTNNLHPYHGITLHQSVGWAIQIKLLDKYRVIRAYADNAETAARRHDIALALLEPFTPPSVVPNFPASYAAIELSPALDKLPEDEQAFRKLVLSWQAELTEDVNSSGGDVNEMNIKRHQDAEKLAAKSKRDTVIARANLLTAIHKIQAGLPACKLPTAEHTKLSDLLDTAIDLLDAPNP